jgi:hypothetical protein
MAQHGLTQIKTEFNDAQVTEFSSVNQPISMDLQIVKVMPFPVHRVAHCVWKCMNTDRIKLHNGFFGGSWISDTMSKLEFAVQLRVHRTESTINVHGISACRLESERPCIVYESVGATKGDLFASGPIEFRERGYAVMEKHPSGDGSTIVKVCVRKWPQMIDSRKEGGEPDISRFVDLTVGSYNENTETLLQIVENLLLEET